MIGQCSCLRKELPRRVASVFHFVAPFLPCALTSALWRAGEGAKRRSASVAHQRAVGARITSETTDFLSGELGQPIGNFVPVRLVLNIDMPV